MNPNEQSPWTQGQWQTPGQGVAPQGITQPSSPSQSLDPQVVDLAKSIRTVETQGQSNPWTAQGKSGEYGAYQFTQAKWNEIAPQFGVNVPLTQATPQQQNEVVYKAIKQKKDQGWNVGQIASWWNSGNPDAYQQADYKGTNQYGAQYDVPAYAKSVAQMYQNIKSGKSSLGIASPSISSGSSPATQQDKGFFGNIASGNIGGAAKNVLDFAFPIVGDLADDLAGQSQKTLLQQLGDAGLSALWFLPGFGEAGGALANIGKGALIGYGADVASHLSQGETNVGQIVTPGLGAVTGGALGGILPKLSEIIGKNITPEGAVQAVQDNLDKAIGATKSGSKFLQSSVDGGFNPSELLTKSNSIPDIVDGKFVTADAAQNIQNRINQLGEARATALDSLGKTVPLNDLRSEALSRVSDLKATGETAKITKQINSLFDDFKTNYGKDLTPSELEKIKEVQAASSGIYKRTGQIGETNASSIIGDVARSKIESLADEAGFPGMKEYNKYIQAHYNALDALNKINGQVVKGGRLGNILRGKTVAGLAGAADLVGGGGLLSAMAAGFAGEKASDFISKILADTSFSNPLRDAILSKIGTENPEIVQKLQQFVTGQAVQSGDVSKIAAALNIGGKVAPTMTPTQNIGSRVNALLPSLFTKAGARGMSTVGSTPSTLLPNR